MAKRGEVLPNMTNITNRPGGKPKFTIPKPVEINQIKTAPPKPVEVKPVELPTIEVKPVELPKLPTIEVKPIEVNPIPPKIEMRADNLESVELPKLPIIEVKPIEVNPIPPKIEVNPIPPKIEVKPIEVKPIEVKPSKPAESSEPTRRLNYTPSKPDNRDHSISFVNKYGISVTNTVKVSASTNKSVDLSKNCTTIKDQGKTGSCTSFATVAAMEYLMKKFAGRDGDIFSERFTYYTTRVNILGWPANEDSGAYVRDALRSTVKYGSCLENTFPYNEDFSVKPPQEAYDEAKKYQAVGYARYEEGTSSTDRANLIQNLKLGLDSGFPIIAGFTCYSNIWNAVNGVIPMQNGEIVGGHAILIVGYDDSKKLFKFKNSWGSSWGDNGYGYLPYNYYLAGDLTDLWTLYSQELNDIKVIGGQISNPTAIKQAINSNITAIFGNVTENIATATDKSKYIVFFNNLQQQYKSDIKLSNLINNLKTSFSALVS